MTAISPTSAPARWPKPTPSSRSMPPLPAPFAEGAAGAGTGMSAFGFKGGIGTASRHFDLDGSDHTLGVLALANFGNAGDLVLPDGRRPVPPETKPQSERGSVILVIATDVPLESRRIATRRTARRRRRAARRLLGQWQRRHRRRLSWPIRSITTSPTISCHCAPSTRTASTRSSAPPRGASRRKPCSTRWSQRPPRSGATGITAVTGGLAPGERRLRPFGPRLAEHRHAPAVRVDAIDIDLAGADHPVDMDQALVAALRRDLLRRQVRTIDETFRIALPQRDMAGGVLVEERVVEQDAALRDRRRGMRQRDFAEPARASSVSSTLFSTASPREALASTIRPPSKRTSGSRRSASPDRRAAWLIAGDMALDPARMRW